MESDKKTILAIVGMHVAKAASKALISWNMLVADFYTRKHLYVQDCWKLQ